jgi:hypothetical protein
MEMLDFALILAIKLMATGTCLLMFIAIVGFAIICAREVLTNRNEE